MADPLRKQIRDAVKTAVKTVTAFGDRVYIGRNDALPTDQMPAAAVFLRDEKMEKASFGSGGAVQYRVELEVAVEAYAKQSGADLPEEQLDAFRESIIAAVMADPTLGSIVLEISPTGSVRMESSDGAVNLGNLTTTFTALYFETRTPTQPGDP